MPNDVTNTNAAILTLDSDAVLETAQSKADLIWHDIQNAYRTRKILTGTLGGIEKTEAGNLIAVIYYKEFRAVIPITEMMINLLQDEAHDYGSLSLRQNKVLNNMLGCEIDFIIKGLDTKTRSIVASRKEAMLKKRQIFYLDQDVSGQTKVYVDRIVQARVIAVAEVSPLTKHQQILFQTADQTEYRFTLDKHSKLLTGHHYRLYFRRQAGLQMENNPRPELLGYEELSSIGNTNLES